MIYIKLNNRTCLQPSHRCPSCIARQRCRNPAEQHRSPCCVHISAAIICQPEVPETKTRSPDICRPVRLNPKRPKRPKRPERPKRFQSNSNNTHTTTKGQREAKTSSKQITQQGSETTRVPHMEKAVT